MPICFGIMSKYRKLVLTGSMRRYIIEKVKRPLMKKIISLACKYPEPTRENVRHPNALRLLDIQDKFFKYEDNAGRDALFRAIWRILIAEYEHDPYYRNRMDWVLEEINKGDWLHRSERSMYCWKEQREPQVSRVEFMPLKAGKEG